MAVLKDGHSQSLLCWCWFSLHASQLCFANSWCSFAFAIKVHFNVRYTSFNKFNIMLCCLKARYLGKRNNWLYLISILEPTATRHEPPTLCMLFTLGVNHPWGFIPTRCVHCAAYNCELAWCVRLQLADPILSTNFDNTAFCVEEQTFFFTLALHLISVNAQFLFSSTRRSLSSHPPSKLPAQLGV